MTARRNRRPTPAEIETAQSLEQDRVRRNRLIGAIKAAVKAHGMDDEIYRAMLEQVTGKTSCAKMHAGELVRVLDHLNSGRRARGADECPQAAKVRALWIAGWNLGVVRAREDAALRAFVKRQSGIDAERWLRNPADARKVIEALKSWLAREAGVEWGDKDSNPRKRVVEAQWRVLVEMDVIRHPEWVNAEHFGYRVTGKAGFHFYRDEDWDHLIGALGRKIHATLADRNAATLKDWRKA
jgi:phage gp16-like protein